MALGVKIALWSRAAKKSGNWYRGVVDAAGRFMMKWHRTETDKHWPIHATVDTKNSNKGTLEGGGGGTHTAVDERRIEMVHMVWQGTGSTNTWSVFKYSNDLNPIVSGSVLLCLYSSSSTGGARTRL